MTEVNTTKITKAFFDSTLDYNWNMKPIDRSFNSKKVNKYLSLLSEPDRSFVEKLILETKYVHYSEFENALLNSLQMFINKIKSQEFYYAISKYKIGSEHWLTALLWPHLKKLNMKEIIDQSAILPALIPINIVILDDGSYSGINVYGVLDELLYNMAESVHPKAYEMSKEEIKKFNKYVTFHLVIPYISEVAHDFILAECKLLGCNCIMYATYYMPPLKSLMDIKKYYPKDEENILKSRFAIATAWEEQNPIIEMPAFYFDHKVASDRSTFSSIYLDGHLPDGSKYGSLFKVDPSRVKIEELQQIYMNF